MTNYAKTLAAPVFIITLGLGWLLTVQNLVPGVNWIWVLGLAVVGFLVLAAGVDKVTFVVGLFLVSSTFFSILRQTGRISSDVEVPTLVIGLRHSDADVETAADPRAEMDHRAGQSKYVATNATASTAANIFPRNLANTPSNWSSMT
jgi:hypothetical protein